MLLAVVIAGQAFAAGNQLFEAEATKHISGAASLPDRSAAGGCVVSLTRSGAGVEFTKLPAAGKLAIRYASVSVGTIIGVGGGFSSPVIAGGGSTSPARLVMISKCAGATFFTYMISRNRE